VGVVVYLRSGRVEAGGGGSKGIEA
jgi:hypothetical protein